MFANSPAAIHKSASSPAIIRVPSNATGQYIGQKQHIKLHPSGQGGQPRIIKITRVGANSNGQGAINLANLQGAGPGTIRLSNSGATSINQSLPANLAGKKIIITNGIAKTRPLDNVHSSLQSQPEIVRSTNSPVQFIGQSGFNGGKIFPSSTSGISLLNKHVPQSLPSNIPAMVHSPSMPNLVHSANVSVPNDVNVLKTNITQKDISRLWSNQDFKLKSVTQNIQHHAGMSRSLSQVCIFY